MSIVEAAAILVILSAVLGWINKVYIGLPHAIGLLVMGLIGTLGMLAADYLFPSIEFARMAHKFMSEIDFFDTLMNGMLAFLLFAGSLHVNFAKLREQKAAVLLLASVGVLVSTTVIGFGIWAIATIANVHIPLIWCLVFGALISPTDPVSVMAVLKNVKVSPRLETKIAGESLFNDGIGVIVFTILLGLAVFYNGWGSTAHDGVVDAHGAISFYTISANFAREVVGAVIAGIVAAAITIMMMKKIDDAALETLISLALVLGLSVLCSSLHMSAPIAVVVAGLMIGNLGAQYAMSETTRQHLFPFWTLVDEVLNSVLFLLIGMEVLIIKFVPEYIGVALIAIPVVLIGRMISVTIPITMLKGMRHEFSQGSIRILTWGGVRGGISVALALALPHVPEKQFILMLTYVTVVFSIIVQGLTIEKLVKKLAR